MTTLRTWPARTESRLRNRRALLDAAAELAEEHGYAGTSLGAIAARAGVTTGAIYSIFGSKAELFIELLLPDWNVPPGDEIAVATGDVPSFLDRYAREWASRLRRQDVRKAFELELELYLAALRDPDLLDKTRAIFHASQQALAGQLERLAVASGGVHPPAGELARSVVAVLQGLSQLAVTAGEQPDEDLFARVAVRLASPGDEVA
jgi:AcrR family transcriptional regulator